MVADSIIVVSRIAGRSDSTQRYTVARIDARSIRITRVSDLPEARRTRAEWTAGDFSFDPGHVRRF